ncbi:3311_t:CDS:2, partial [Gigaspora margarita]
ILECIKACVAELRKTNIAWLDIENLTVEQAFFRSFDHIISQQLDPVWHCVGQKTKETQKNIVESDNDDGNSDVIREKAKKKPDKLGYPPEIVPILKKLPK